MLLSQKFCHEMYTFHNRRSPIRTTYNACKLAIGVRVLNSICLFNFSHEATFKFLVYLKTWPQMTFWPWYVTFDLINKWGFQCCIYDWTLAEIHQGMWKLEPNINLFHNSQRRQQQWTKRFYVFFLLRQETQNWKWQRLQISCGK